MIPTVIIRTIRRKSFEPERNIGLLFSFRNYIYILCFIFILQLLTCFWSKTQQKVTYKLVAEYNWWRRSNSFPRTLASARKIAPGQPHTYWEWHLPCYSKPGMQQVVKESRKCSKFESSQMPVGLTSVSFLFGGKLLNSQVIWSFFLCSWSPLRSSSPRIREWNSKLWKGREADRNQASDHGWFLPLFLFP